MIKALFIMLIAMSFIPAGDAASKVMTSELGVAPVYVVWTRFVIGALILLPFTWRAGLCVLWDWRVWFRASLVAGGISCITQAIKFAPLADVFGAFFIAPMISFVLSVWLLKERARLVQALLVVLGFVGVLLIVRPGFETSQGLGWAVIAGCFYGTFLTASRWLAGQVAIGGLMLTQMVGPTLLITPFVLGNFPQITPQIAGLTLVSGACSMAGNVLMLFAYRMQEASKLAPFVYFQLLSAVVLGWAIFGDLPSALTLLGMGVIVVAGSAVAMFQSRRPIALGTERA
ncbi:DMT family transporter [Planktotalea arctica]|uniref:DMT family transporter n=1 Tax=Planktotalea arctica TaxID=1481893 RepID=UPI00321BB648